MCGARELTHPERGTALLEKLAEELSEIAVVEQTPLQDGRNMTMMLGPSKTVLSGEAEGSKPPTEEAAAPESRSGNRHHNGAGTKNAEPAGGAAKGSPDVANGAGTSSPER